MITFVDPGLRACGCAAFKSDGTFLRAALVKSTELRANGPALWFAMAYAVEAWAGGASHFVCELPVVYPHMPVPPEDILQLACVAAWLHPIHVYRPAEWKGTMPGEMFIEERIKPAATRDETRRVELAGSKSHNVWDAVGLGFFHFGRLTPKRSFPGATR